MIQNILLCAHTVDDGKVFWGLIVRGRGREGEWALYHAAFYAAVHITLTLHITHTSQHNTLSPEGRIMIASRRKMTKTLGVQLSQIILIPCSEQSFCVQFLWGCKGGERVSLPSCLQSALPLSPCYSKKGGELSKNSTHCHIFLLPSAANKCQKEGWLPLFTWWWKLWLLFGFSVVLIDFFRCHISCNIVSLKSSASHGLSRRLWQKVGSVYLILTILPPSCVVTGPAHSGAVRASN